MCHTVGGYFSVPPRTVWICCFLLISRIPCLGSGSRTGGLSAFGAHSCLVFAACCLVDTLDNKPIYIHMMRPSPAHTRTRTLQGRLGTRQDGSSGVRSTGRHAEEVIPDLRQNGDEDNEENDYFNELRSPEIIKKGHLCDDDYDLEYDSDVDKVPETTPAAERLLGGADSFQNYMREQRESTTRSSDILAEIEPRPFETIPVKEMATPIDSTRRGLPHLFRLDGQTEHLQAKQAEQAEEFEKESEFEYLSDDVSYELKAMKHFVTSMGAMHEKQIEAMHIDNIFPEFRQGGLPVPDRVNRSAMRYLFGILAFHQHYHPHQEQCQLPTPPPSSLPPPWPPPQPPDRIFPATWAATARQDVC